MNSDNIDNDQVFFGANTLGFFPSAQCTVRLSREELERYKELYKNTFNFATVPFHWNMEEYDLIKYRESVIEWLSSAGIRMKGHALVWFCKEALPKRIQLCGSGKLRKEVYRRVYDLVERYRGIIDVWDVINEPHGPSWSNYFGFSLKTMVDFTRIALEATKDANSSSIAVINCHNVWNAYKMGTRDVSGENYFSELCSRNICFDGIGMQIYVGLVDQLYPAMDGFSELFDRYARFKKGIHLTEIGVPSNHLLDCNSIIGDRVESKWNETEQSEWLSQLYSLALSKKYIRYISYWDFADYPRHFWPHAGLLRNDLSRKISYTTVRRLIERYNIKHSAQRSE